MGLGKLLLNLIFGKGSYKKVKSEVERDMKNSPFFNEMKRRAEIVDSKEFKMWRQSLKDEEKKKREKLSQEEKEEIYSLREKQIEKDKKKILKLSREKIKRDIEFLSRPGLTDYQRYWKDHLVRHPELKTTQPELYNKILMICDVAEELKTKKCEKIGEND